MRAYWKMPENSGNHLVETFDQASDGYIGNELDTTDQLHAELKNARYASLNARPKSPNAILLVEHLASDQDGWEISIKSRTRARGSRRIGLLDAISGFLGDLLEAQNTAAAHGWSYRPMGNSSFSGGPVSARHFESARKCWEARGYLEVKPGFVRATEWEHGMVTRGGGYTTRFRATPKLLALCEKFGITPWNVAQHFTFKPPEHPLVLKSASTRTSFWKNPGKPMTFSETDTTRRLESRVKELNDFLLEHRIEGANHRHLIRVFNEGDRGGFEWNKGGRLYSDGRDSYQQLSSAERVAMLRIDGSPVCEIDIKASYLTILHGRYGEPFEVSDEYDPYVVEGIPRGVTKAWCTIRFGSKKAPKSWPKDACETYKEKSGGDNLRKYDIKEVGRQLCEKYPLLKRWDELPETWADLMFLESEAIVDAMWHLMALDIPSLPVHDSLLVPLHAEETAMEVLRGSYSVNCGVDPYLVVHRPPMDPLSTQGQPETACRTLEKHGRAFAAFER